MQIATIIIQQKNKNYTFPFLLKIYKLLLKKYYNFYNIFNKSKAK